MSGVPVIAVDFDGTLVDYDETGAAFPVPGAREAMEALRSQGAYLVIHTCRTTIARQKRRLDQELNFIAETLDAFGIPFDEIYPGDKMVADVYIDDRAISYSGTWVGSVKDTFSYLARTRR